MSNFFVFIPSVAKEKGDLNTCASWGKWFHLYEGQLPVQCSSVHFVSKKSATEQPNPIPATASRETVRIKYDVTLNILYLNNTRCTMLTNLYRSSVGVERGSFQQ